MFVAAAVAWPDTPSALKAVRTLAKFLPTLCSVRPAPEPSPPQVEHGGSGAPTQNRKEGG